MGPEGVRYSAGTAVGPYCHEKSPFDVRTSLQNLEDRNFATPENRLKRADAVHLQAVDRPGSAAQNDERLTMLFAALFRSLGPAAR